MGEPRYDPQTIEPHWRRDWAERHLFEIDLQHAARPCYALVMLPYPSGDRLHVGHWYHYGPADSWARFMRMRGWNVFAPIGFDAFGMPAENYAVRTGVHPRDSTNANVANMVEQLETMGAMWDWRHTADTSQPIFYRWTQWIFLQLFRAGLAYRKAAPVWWCPTDQTVLANEQVVGDNVCERCRTPVVKRDLTQWFFRITAYADELLDGLGALAWPERTKSLQRNWIGRSEGAEIVWPVVEQDTVVRTFTTRPDTLYGVTFLALAPEHPLVETISAPEQWGAVSGYRERTRRLSEIERTSTEAEKTGVFTGAFARHPLTGAPIPIWIADFVLATYGTGAIQGVPAHDARDWEFAHALALPIVSVITPDGPADDGGAYTGHGAVTDSGPYTGMRSEEMIPRVIADLAADGRATPSVHYRLRDWLISRQRYWGAPIPIIHCRTCGEVAVPDESLPVRLPYDVDFSLGGGQSPLARSAAFMDVACPACGGAARRDPDTMDTFVDSTWYFLRYLSPGDTERSWDPVLAATWCPVYQYSGGIDHATLHLLYSRFMVKALRDLGHLPFGEPFERLVHQGTITYQGAKMSKSRGNVVSPDAYIARYGSDAFRAYLMFGFTYIEGGDWKDEGIRATAAWLQRVWRLVDGHRALWTEAADTTGGERAGAAIGPAGHQLELVRHQSVKGATDDFAIWQFNTAIARVMELVNAIYQAAPLEGPVVPGVPAGLLRETLETLIRLLAPIAPHLADELWTSTGHAPSVVDAGWPAWDPAVLRTAEVTVVVQVNGTRRDELRVPRGLPADELQARALAHGRIPALLEGRPPRKVIVVTDKLVNVVV
ncbi:MAG: leucine--tRNA ligase [Gemmatimonadota bacterium]